METGDDEGWNRPARSRRRCWRRWRRQGDDGGWCRPAAGPRDSGGCARPGDVPAARGMQTGGRTEEGIAPPQVLVIREVVPAPETSLRRGEMQSGGRTEDGIAPPQVIVSRGVG